MTNFLGAPRLPVHRFNLENYCSKLGYSSVDGWDYKLGKPKSGFTMVGWIPSEKLYHLRPNKNALVVMLYETPREVRDLRTIKIRVVGGEDFWIHIPYPDK